MPTTRLFLVRHGATQLTAENRFSGAVGVDLSDEGRWQAAKLGERLRHDRCRPSTAAPCRGRWRRRQIIGTTVRPDADRRATACARSATAGGKGSRAPRSRQRFGDEYAAWEEDPFTFAPEGGESGVAVLARALPVIREIVTHHPGERVVVVSHKATIRLLLSSLLGFDARGYRDRLDQAPACLNVLDFRDAVRARLMLFNDTSHYAHHQRSAQGNLSRWWDGALTPRP